MPAHEVSRSLQQWLSYKSIAIVDHDLIDGLESYVKRLNLRTEFSPRELVAVVAAFRLRLHFSTPYNWLLWPSHVFAL